MSQQSFGMRAGPSAYSMDSRDERNMEPEPKKVNPDEKQEDKVDYNSLEEALTGN